MLELRKHLTQNMGTISLKIDIKPISVNAAFQGRRFKTADCKAYERLLWYKLPRKGTLLGDVEIWFDFFLVNYKKTDISNLVKVTEDILVKKKYIEDDRKIVRMHLAKHKAERDMMTIKIQKK